VITADPGQPFDATLELGAAMSGLTGILAIQVINAGQRVVEIARSTAGITEFPAGSGVYGVQLTAPLAPGVYAIVWDTTPDGQGLNPSNSWLDELQVAIELPTFPGGWSWSPWGWLWPDWGEWNLSNQPAGSNPVPTAADVRQFSQLDFCQYGYPPPMPGQPDTALAEMVNRAEAMFWRITGQTLDELDPKIAPMVRRVIQGMTEQMVMQGAQETLETQSDFDLIASLNAGPYSETRRDPGAMRKAWMLHPVPWISDALWQLLTEERYGFYWHFFSGSDIPAFATTDVFWADGLEVGRLWGPGWGYYFGA
jgi:hypothetical protein